MVNSPTFIVSLSSGQSIDQRKKMNRSDAHISGRPAPNSAFWDRVASRYSRKPIADEGAYEAKLAITREYLSPDMHLLELGCGTGGTALKHAPFVKRVVATDISPAMIGIANQRRREANIQNVEFAVAPVERLDFDENSFDMVLALSLLHLVEDRVEVLNEAVRILRPGGYFVSSTPCLDGTIGLMRHILPIGARIGLMPKVFMFTKAGLRGDIASAGLRIQRAFEPSDGRTLFVVAQKPRN